MKPIFCIVGKSGAGKSTYLAYLMNDDRFKELNIKELKYHTTRSRRTPTEDSYYFTTMQEYNNIDKNNIIESRVYKKYDEEVVYYTTKSDLEVEDCNALICAASVDQLLSYYNKLDNVFIINIEVAETKERLLRLIYRCKNDTDCYEVCRRTLEEESEYSKLFNTDFGNNMITIYNDNDSRLDFMICNNVSKIIQFITSKLNRIN